MNKRERDFIKRRFDHYMDLFMEHRDDDFDFAYECLVRASCLQELLATLNRNPFSLWIFGGKHEDS